MSCWVYTFVLSNFFFLFYIVFFCFFSRRHSGWFYAQAWKSTRFPFVFLDCTVTTHSVSELLTVFVSGCSTSCGHLPWISVVLLCLSLSLFFFLFFLFFKSFFHCCISQELVHSSACNHNNSLIMFIDFNIKIIKPLAPHPDSRV